MGETVGVGAGAGPGAAADAEKGVVAVGTGPTVGAAGPEGKETPWDGGAKEDADVTGTVVGASRVEKVEETESGTTGSLLPQLPQKACPLLGLSSAIQTKHTHPFMGFPGQTRSTPSTGYPSVGSGTPVSVCIGAAQALTPPENRAFLAPASAEASRF